MLNTIKSFIEGLLIILFCFLVFFLTKMYIANSSNGKIIYNLDDKEKINKEDIISEKFYNKLNAEKSFDHYCRFSSNGEFICIDKSL